MSQYVYPSVELANLDPGRLFLHNDKTYILIAHKVQCVEIARYFWWDRLLAKLIGRIEQVMHNVKEGH